MRQLRLFAAPAAVAAIAAAALFLCAPRDARAEIKRIWALDDGTKIKATDTSNALASGNGTFDGKTIKIFAARNETVAFQVIIEGGAAVTQKVALSLAALGPLKNEGTTDTAGKWFIGRRIEIFKQHYFNITEPSLGLVWRSNTAAVPTNMLGWVPDALIPLRASDTFDVPAGRNQGAWVDVTVPKGTAPGVHKGTLAVTVDGTACSLPTCSIPVELTVLSATLPDTTRAATMLYFAAGERDRDHMPARYFDDPFAADAKAVQTIRDRHYQLARRHRITLILGKIDAPNEDLRRRVSGELFQKVAGYEGPGEGLGQDIYSISTYGGTLTPAQGKVWNDFFAKNAPSCLYFLYTFDEPWGSSDLAVVNQRSKAAKPVLSFVTAAYTPSLPDTDIFATLAEEWTPANRDDGKKAGKRVWVYNGFRPYSGTFVTDDVAVSPRVNPWLMYKYDIERWFYWDSAYYNDFQGNRGQINVFQNPNNFRNKFGHRVNGDGLLFYPGRDRVFKVEDRGFDMPLPSIRLKNWRRGIQDVEYMLLAAKAGHGAAVTAIVDRMVPKGFRSGVGSSSAKVPWSEDGEKWLQARKDLARLLGASASSDGGTPPSDASGGGADAGVGGDSGAPAGDATTGGDDDDGCCSVGAKTPSASSALVCLGLALTLLFARRRRRR